MPGDGASNNNWNRLGVALASGIAATGHALETDMDRFSVHIETENPETVLRIGAALTTDTTGPVPMSDADKREALDEVTARTAEALVTLGAASTLRIDIDQIGIGPDGERIAGALNLIADAGSAASRLIDGLGGLENMARHESDLADADIGPALDAARKAARASWPIADSPINWEAIPDGELVNYPALLYANENGATVTLVDPHGFVTTTSAVLAACGLYPINGEYPRALSILYLDHLIAAGWKFYKGANAGPVAMVQQMSIDMQALAGELVTGMAKGAASPDDELPHSNS